MKKIFSFNFFSRIIFLLLTPAFFSFLELVLYGILSIGGVITNVVLIWMFFILISPLFERVGCGWFCFMGTAMI